MPRALRVALGGWVYHVLNRANGRMRIFDRPQDYGLFEQVLLEAHEQVTMRTLSYCVMPNHWHLVLWPRADGDLSAFMRWLTMTHTQRWHAAAATAGAGHLYQGRFKSFPIQRDAHLLTVCRYVERNPLRAGLVGRAEDWRWDSLWRRTFRDAEAQVLLHDGPTPRARNWRAWVNQPQTEAELAALRRCVAKGRPFGGEVWVKRSAARLGLRCTLRPPEGTPAAPRPPPKDATSRTGQPWNQKQRLLTPFLPAFVGRLWPIFPHGVDALPQRLIQNVAD